MGCGKAEGIGLLICLLIIHKKKGLVAEYATILQKKREEWKWVREGLEVKFRFRFRLQDAVEYPERLFNL